jgi:hypothetical protein
LKEHCGTVSTRDVFARFATSATARALISTTVDASHKCAGEDYGEANHDVRSQRRLKFGVKIVIA